MRRLAATVLVVAMAATGCAFDGINALALPGTVGTGDDSFELIVELPDVGTLVENAEVKLGDVVIGTVTDLAVDRWHAQARVSVEEGTALPESTRARVGMNTLLGAAYLELSVPPGPHAEMLSDGDVVHLQHSGVYPSTEQVLAATSVVLNGGGLQQLRTITAELNRALGTRAGSGVRTLLPRLNRFIGALDGQRADIVSAIRGLDELSGTFARDIDVVDRALDRFHPALSVLVNNRPDLTRALRSLDRLSTVSTTLVKRSKAGVVSNLRDLAPVLAALNRSGDAVVGGTRYLFTPPFAPEGVPNACRGDYCNLFLTLDLSTAALLENFGPPIEPPLDTEPSGERLGGVPGAIRDTPRLSKATPGDLGRLLRSPLLKRSNRPVRGGIE